jgi:hypothetical protein
MTAPNDPLASMGEPGTDPAPKDADSGHADGARTREGLEFPGIAGRGSSVRRASGVDLGRASG